MNIFIKNLSTLLIFLIICLIISTLLRIFKVENSTSLGFIFFILFYLCAVAMVYGVNRRNFEFISNFSLRMILRWATIVVLTLLFISLGSLMTIIF